MRKSEKEALQAMLDDEQETIKALEKASVSYTHLTLPTILLV